MDSMEFISKIKIVVRDRAIKGVIEILEDPPGRRISEFERRRSNWFNEQTEEGRVNIESIVTDAVDEALFGILCVIDGVRTIEDGPEKGCLQLVYRNRAESLLNDPNKIGLHDLYNS